MSQYRDPLAGLRSQVATKRAALADRKISPIVRAMLPPGLTKTMSALAPRAAASGDDLASLSDQDASLDALLVATDEAIALAPKLVELPDEVPDPRRPDMPPPWLYEEPSLVRFKKDLTERVNAIADREAWLVRWGDFEYISRIRVDGTPLVLHAAKDVQIGGFVCSLRTSVPARVPKLEVRRERAYHAVGRAMHLAKEVTLGDALFDRTFWIAGDEATATLLVPEVRDALLSLSGHRLSLLCDRGVVVVVWSGATSESSGDVLPDAAVAAVRGFRGAIA